MDWLKKDSQYISDETIQQLYNCAAYYAELQDIDFDTIRYWNDSDPENGGNAISPEDRVQGGVGGPQEQIRREMREICNKTRDLC